MTKQITEYYCDMCGKKVPWVMSFRLPDMTTRTAYDRCGALIIKELTQIVPEECDLCESCAKLVYLSIKEVKNIIEEN